MLPLTFTDPEDYNRIDPFDRVSLRGLTDLAPGKVSPNGLSLRLPFTYFSLLLLQPVRCVVKHADGRIEEFDLAHTMNETQISWFKAGSALNKMAEMFK